MITLKLRDKQLHSQLSNTMLAWAKRSFGNQFKQSSLLLTVKVQVIIYLHLTDMEIINWCPKSQTSTAKGVLCYSWRPWLQSGLSIHWPGVIWSHLESSCSPYLCMNQLKGCSCCQWNWLDSLRWGFMFSLWELEQGSKIWIQMRGNSFNVLIGHLGEFGKEKTVSLSAGI